MELTKTFASEQYARALESWDWLEIKDKRPICTSLFGDLFMASGTGIWFLGCIDGTLTRIWDSIDAMKAELATDGGQDRYLLGGIAMAAERAGLILEADQVYDFAPPPILGGPIDVNQIMIMDFVVAVNIAGQLHRQIKSLPPGTRITGVHFDDRDAALKLLTEPGT